MEMSEHFDAPVALVRGNCLPLHC